MSYLCHHGIKGQKWGVRRFQNEDGSYTEAGKQRRSYKNGRDRINAGKATNRDLKKLSGSIYIHDLDSSIRSVGYKFSNEQMSALGSTKLKELNDTNRIFTDNEGYNRVTAVQALRKSQPLNLDDDLVMNSVCRRINPNYGEKGTTNNCVRCATAMTLAKMGYSTPNGLSAGVSATGANHEGFSYWFDGAKAINGNQQSISQELSRQPKGSFGEFNISRYDANGNRTGGHAMTYSILNDGSVRFEDPQDGTTFKSMKDAMAHCGASDIGMSFTRLDNTKPNFAALEQDNMIDVARSKSNNSYLPQKVTGVNSIHPVGNTTIKVDSYGTPYVQMTNRIKEYNWSRDDHNFMSFRDAVHEMDKSIKSIQTNDDYSNYIIDKYGDFYLRTIGR